MKKKRRSEIKKWSKLEKAAELEIYTNWNRNIGYIISYLELINNYLELYILELNCILFRINKIRIRAI